MSSFDAARRTMVDCQLRTFDVSDRAVLAAMAEVPRERYVPADRQALAYLDRNILLAGEDPRAILAPMIFARMVQALAVQAGDRALDVGGALGYGAAIFAALGADPVLVESRADLTEGASDRLPGIPVRSGPLDQGAKDDGPFDCILVNGAVAERPAALLSQLSEGGRLACISTEQGAGRALLYVRSGDGFGFRSIIDVMAPSLAAFQPKPAFVF